MTATRHSTQPLKLYDFELSGHCHRVRLMLSLLDLPYQSITVDLLGGEHRRPPFLALNPFGQVPVLRDGEITLADSNAILVYLAAAYGDEHWLPRAPARAAAVQRWLSVAAGEIAHGPGAARGQVLFKLPGNAEECLQRADRLLKVMDRELRQREFLAGATPSIADVAGYTYIAHAPEGHVSLAAFEHVRAWLARVEQLPRFVGMRRSPVAA